MRIGAVGAAAAIAGYGLGGAVLFEADDEQAIRQAWDSLPADVGIVILTPEAARTLQDRLHRPGTPMIAVMPR